MKPGHRFKNSFESGRRAFREGLSMDDNPHRHCSQQHQPYSNWWQAGFNQEKTNSPLNANAADVSVGN